MKNFLKMVCAVLIIVLIVVYLNYRDHRFTQLLKEQGRFTIGYAFGVAGNVNVPAVRFKYYVDGKYFECSQSIKNNNIIHHYFYVIFTGKDPSKARILLYYPIPNKIREAPNNGWETIPDVDYKMRDSLNLEIYKEESNENLNERNWK